MNEWDYDRKIEKKYRYRTETFSGLEEYDPAAVIDHETFELQNADIPEYLANTILKDSPLAAKLMKIVQWLEYDDIEPPVDEEKSIDFCREIVAEIEKVTGISLNYVLWLTDLDAVTDKDFYGKYINNEYDIDTYQIGHIVLAELGYDGTLYGYTNHPIPLEKQLEELKDALKDVTDERESDTLTVHRADHLDARYTELDNEISMIKKVLNVKESLTREKLNKQK